MPDALNGFSLLATPQSEAADSRQVRNSAGGYTFVVDEMERLRRFLILGTEGGTYYSGERELTRDNARFVSELAVRRGVEVVREIVAVSDAGRAPKNNQALFALALVSTVGDLWARQAAYRALPKVARTGTHLFQFLAYRKTLGTGWSAGLRRAVSDWYVNRSADQAAYQIAKYGQREGWTHRDVLRKAHPKFNAGPLSPEHDTLFGWTVGKDVPEGNLPKLVRGVRRARLSTSAGETARLIRGYGLTWEMVPTEHLNDRVVWEALLETDSVGITALIRQLPRLTKVGLLSDKTWRDTVMERLVNADLLRKGRVHPINLLVALRTYASGTSVRGSGTWTPVSHVVDALDAAFYVSFRSVTPTGTRHLVALDVSGSMSAPVNGLPLNCREASAAMAMATVATETDATVVGFTSRSGFGGWGSWGRPQRQVDEGLTVLDVSARRRLDDNIREVSNLPFGGTDASLPMLWALEKGREFDSFSVWTDNETWAGSMHPHEALRRYRRETGIHARLAVAGMSSTGFTIADPSDAGMVDVVGLDASVPNLLSDFFRGDI